MRNLVRDTSYVLGLVGALTGCRGTLRMDTWECDGIYREQMGLLSRFNQVTSQEVGKTTIMIDYTDRTVDWRNAAAKRDLGEDNIDRLLIKTSGVYEVITPKDSSSQTDSGKRARNLLIRWNELYRNVRGCFIDWARRDYRNTH